MNEFKLKIIHFFLSAFFTFWLLKIFIPLLKKNFPAQPNNRSLHNSIKASGGGITFIIVYMILAIYQGFLLPLFSLPLSLIGLIDDKYNISRGIRLIFQIVTLIFIISHLSNDSSSFLFNINSYKGLLITLLIFTGTAIINFINFMDGIDGLVCGCMIVIFTTINNEFHYLSPIIGTLSAFLMFNWYPSKIFMGDIGSLFLGSFLVSLILSSNSFITFLKIILLSSPLLFDAASCLFRRFINKQNIFKPHTLHLYQRLVNNGMSHNKVSMIYIFSTSILGLFYIFSNIFALILCSIIILFIGVYLDIKFAKEFDVIQF